MPLNFLQLITVNRCIGFLLIFSRFDSIDEFICSRELDPQFIISINQFDWFQISFYMYRYATLRYYVIQHLQMHLIFKFRVLNFSTIRKNFMVIFYHMH